jgi:amidase
MDAAELAFAGVARQSELVRAGEVSSRELVELYLERIERLDGRLNAFRVMRPDAALEEADRRDVQRAGGEDLPLLGVPVAIKDTADVAGETTSHGTGCFETPQESDADMVRRLRDAGAVILGKTNLPELAVYGFTESKTWGFTRNPWDPSRTPGGSSGGSGSAVAAGLVGVASGSDGAGSIRIPAANCGLFGLKPQRGRITMSPDLYVDRGRHWHGLSVNGCVSRTVADTALYLDVTAGAAPGDLDAPSPPGRPFAEAAATSPETLRIAWSTKAPRLLAPPYAVSDANRAALDGTVSLLSSLGHEVAEREPDFGLVGNHFSALYLNGIRQDAIRTPHRERLERRTAGIARLGGLQAGPGVRRAHRVLERYAARINAVFDDHDVLLTLVSPVPQVEVGRWEGRGGVRTVIGMSRVYPYTGIWNYLGNPAASVPAGFADDGLPLSVQLVGRPGDEETLLSLSAQLEAERPWADKRPAIS